MKKYQHGEIIWRDLSVDDAEQIKAFYEKVVGGETKPHDMGSYQDYDVMLQGESDAFTGICHRKETNVDIPNVWMNYIYVDSVKAAIEACEAAGGRVITQRKMGKSDFAVLEDPSGAIFAILH